MVVTMASALNPRCDPDKMRDAARAKRTAHPHRGHAQTAATKAKISAALKGRKHPTRQAGVRGQGGKTVVVSRDQGRPGRCCTHTPKPKPPRKRVA